MSIHPQEPSAPAATLPAWAADLVQLYESGAANQFILYGNISDRMALPLGADACLGSLTDFLLRALLARFDVVLSYDLGNGIRVEKGGDIFTQWPAFKDNQELPRTPRPAIETLTHYFRYCANLNRLKGTNTQVACLLTSAELVAPALPGSLNYDLNALALLMRDWASETLLAEHGLATFLMTANLNDLHPLVTGNPRCSRVKVPLPSPDELAQVFHLIGAQYPKALSGYGTDFALPAAQLGGATVSAVESLLKTSQYRSDPIDPADLTRLKKQLVEQDCGGLIEFLEPDRTLEDLHGQEKVKAWLRQDIALWNRGEDGAMPMGYLLCGPVGTGKTFLVECLAGEAQIPVVKLRNFRDRWIGSTEGNLERIFRLIHALGRCYVFVDEADQALGRRDSSSGDSGVSGRVYSMLAEEMSDTRNRGRVIWILASSRPDLIEVDLKRPGRIDVKIPLFPTGTAAEGLELITALCNRRGVLIGDATTLIDIVPPLLTPGAAESIAIKAYRLNRAEDRPPMDALRHCLESYRSPVAASVLEFQIGLAVQEASDLDFIPDAFRIDLPSISPIAR